MHWKLHLGLLFFAIDVAGSNPPDQSVSVVDVLENVAWLAVQYLANFAERTEADGLGLAGFQN